MRPENICEKLFPKAKNLSNVNLNCDALRRRDDIENKGAFSQLVNGIEVSPKVKKITPNISKVSSRTKKRESNLEAKKIFFDKFARREGLKTFSVGQCTDNLLTSLTFPAQGLALTNMRADPATGQGMRVLIGQGEQKGRSGRGTQPMRGKVDGSSKS